MITPKKSSVPPPPLDIEILIDDHSVPLLFLACMQQQQQTIWSAWTR